MIAITEFAIAMIVLMMTTSVITIIMIMIYIIGVAATVQTEAPLQWATEEEEGGEGRASK